MMRQDKLEKEIGLFDNTLIAHKIHPGHFFRPPVGYTNPRIARAIKKFDKKVIGWSLRSYDSVYKEPNKLIERVLGKIKNGDILLFHDNLKVNETSIETIIVESKKNGINFAQTKDLKSILK